LEAQARLAEETRKANEDLAQTQTEQAQAAADWLPYAEQRQQMYSATLANEGQKLANKTAAAQLKMLPLQKRAAYLDNLLKTKQITAQDYENLASKYKLKQAGVKTGKKGSSGGGGGNPPTPQPSM
jgi:predicted DCC family thiol-disulfide oxidoreductase YuxK